MINSNLYLRGQLAARSRDRGHGDIYRIAREEIAAQIKPYIDMKVRLMALTPMIMVFSQDGHQLLNDYPPEVTAAIAQCDQAIAAVYQRFTDVLNTSRY